MAWIRLDDQIAHHPKFLKAGLSSWLWVCCIGFAQKFLTDGHIPYEAVATLAGGIERPQNHIDRLVKVGLLDKTNGGYQIHDYLSFNDSAEVVRKKREQDRVRKESGRNPRGIRAESVRNPIDPSRARASHPIPSVNTKNNNNNGKPHRKHAFCPTDGSAICVPEFLHREFDGKLGNHGQEFDLLAWYAETDKTRQKDQPTVGDHLTFWRESFNAELQRRGWLNGGRHSTNKREAPTYTEWRCPHVTKCNTRTMCEQATILNRPVAS